MCGSELAVKYCGCLGWYRMSDVSSKGGPGKVRCSAVQAAVWVLPVEGTIISRRREMGQLVPASLPSPPRKHTAED